MEHNYIKLRTRQSSENSVIGEQVREGGLVRQ